jgi:AraC-like DNA-binding protein
MTHPSLHQKAGSFAYARASLNPPSSHRIRAAVLRGIESVAGELGVSTHGLLTHAAIDPSYLDEPDERISLDAVIELFREFSRRSAVSDLGVRLATARPVPDIGELGIHLRRENTLLGAIRMFASLLYLHADGTHYTLEYDGRMGLIHLHLSASCYVGNTQVTEYGLLRMVRLLQWMLGDSWVPKFVCFRHRAPANTYLQRVAFGCDVMYEQGLNCVGIDKESFAMPLRTYIPLLGSRKLSASDRCFAHQVASEICRTLPNGTCSAQTIARSLDMDRRTMNRRLATEGTNFSELLNRIRTEVAREHLEATSIRLTQVSEITGFESVSAFSRWFRSTFGTTASDWRNARVGAP